MDRVAPPPSPSQLRVTLAMGTRPEVIKLFPVVQALRADPTMAVRVVTTGQHDLLLDQALAITGIAPDERLPAIGNARSLHGLETSLQSRLSRYVREHPCDVMLVQGDTASAVCAARVATAAGIAVGHIEAGLRSHDLANPWPEEGYRREITALANWHYAPTQQAGADLIAEGVDPTAVVVIGNTGVDAMKLLRGEAPPITGPKDRRLIIVTCHRRENLDRGIDRVVDAVLQLAQRNDVAIAWPAHPNPRVVEATARLAKCANVHRLPALDYPQFLGLIDAAHLILSDSGGLQEEAPSFGKPLLVLREVTERPEGLAAGVARLVGTDSSTIVAETVLLLDDPDHYAAMARPIDLYGDGRAAQRIADHLANVVAKQAEPSLA